MPIIGVLDSAKTGRISTNAFDSIATYSGGVSSITFSSIPSTYTHLQIRGICRTNRADYQDVIGMQINTDSGNSYTWHYIVGNGSSIGKDGSGSSATYPVWTSLIAGGSTDSNSYGPFMIDILDYKNTNKYKVGRQLSGMQDTGGTGTYGRNMLGGFSWTSTSAITSIYLYPIYGTSFSANSSFALYGIK